jgi:uncharacterized protein (TIGR03437 family)
MGPEVSPGSLLYATLTGGGSFPPPVTFNPSYTTVTVNGAAVPVLGSDGQRGVLFQLPPDTSLGPTLFSVALQFPLGGKEAWTTSLNAVASSFGVYTIGNGYGPVSAANAVTSAAVNMENPAHPGDIISVWGTGLGSATSNQVTVLLGGHAAQVLYAGPAPGLPGVDQVNFAVPNDPSIPDGCFVALQVTSSPYPNNIASLPKASVPGPCTSPYDFSADDISQLESGAAVDVIDYGISDYVSWSAVNSGFVRSESANVFWAPTHLQTLSANNLLFADDVFYSCTPISASTIFRSGDEIDEVIYPLGEDTSISGPPGSAVMPNGQLNLPMAASVVLPSQLPSPHFVAGTWQISDAATNNPPTIQTAIALPTPVALTDAMATQPITTQQDYSYSWDPTGFTGSDFVSLTINGYYGIIGCRVPATAGQISIPGSLIAKPPALTTGSVTIYARRRPGGGTPADLQTAPFTPGLFTYLFQVSYPVQIQ